MLNERDIAFSIVQISQWLSSSGCHFGGSGSKSTQRTYQTCYGLPERRSSSFVESSLGLVVGIVTVYVVVVVNIAVVVLLVVKVVRIDVYGWGSPARLPAAVVSHARDGEADLALGRVRAGRSHQLHVAEPAVHDIDEVFVNAGVVLGQKQSTPGHRWTLG